MLAVVFFVLYACSVGVSASTQAGTLSANTLHSSEKTVTKTITKTDHTTSTVFVDSTTTATSTVTDTSTSTITSTTTSAVCCQTTTATVTDTVTTTSTATLTPNVEDESGSDVAVGTVAVELFDSGGSPCTITLTLLTSGVGSSDTVTVQLFNNPIIDGDIGAYVVASGGDNTYTNTWSAAFVQIVSTETTGISITYSLTAICPTS